MRSIWAISTMASVLVVVTAASLLPLFCTAAPAGGGCDGATCLSSSSSSLELDDLLSVSWVSDTKAGLATFTATLNSSAWVAIGFAKTPAGNMIGNSAIVYRPDANNSKNSVLEYDLKGMSVPQVTPVAKQVITNAAGSDLNGTTSFSFTRPFAPGGGLNPINAKGNTTLIWAYGSDTTWRQHIKAGHASANIAGGGGVKPTPPPPSPSPSPPTPSPPPPPAPSPGKAHHAVVFDKKFSMAWTFSDTAVTVTATLVGTPAWAAVGWSPDEKMVPNGDAVVFRPTSAVPVSSSAAKNGSSSSAVSEYALTAYSTSIKPYATQVISKASGTQNSTHTVFTFTRPLAVKGRSVISNVPGNNTTTLWAYGAGDTWAQHVAQGVVKVDYATGGSTAKGIATLVIIHGVLMFLSMGFLMPFGAVVARFGKDALPGGAWFRAHRAIQYVAVVLCAAGVAIIVYYTANGSGAHFASTHGKIGLTAVILALLQPVNAYFRPGKMATWRTKWEYFHKGTGWCVPLLAVANIVLALLNITPSSLLIGYAVFVGLFCLAIVYLIIRPKRDDAYAVLSDAS